MTTLVSLKDHSREQLERLIRHIDTKVDAKNAADLELSDRIKAIADKAPKNIFDELYATLEMWMLVHGEINSTSDMQVAEIITGAIPATLN